jgi:hypothetical protein
MRGYKWLFLFSSPSPAGEGVDILITYCICNTKKLCGYLSSRWEQAVDVISYVFLESVHTAGMCSTVPTTANFAAKVSLSFLSNIWQ